MPADAPPLSAKEVAELRKTMALLSLPLRQSDIDEETWCFVFASGEHDFYHGEGAQETGEMLASAINALPALLSMAERALAEERKPAAFPLSLSDIAKLRASGSGFTGKRDYETWVATASEHWERLCDMAASSVREPASEEDIENAVAEFTGEEPWRQETVPLWRICERFHRIAPPAAGAEEDGNG